ncbi:D-alanyl-D-alanine carboxypeptidase [Alkalihalobacillus alcalophilus ATCC 27647 = CGMCC 1.3604]|nr:D-alanyl-D-alanine carboxypeptidase family protein [Alkalihalobacillus alcalophilus]MED1560398.1 D-alanyl-D-alanine carboxypeptidase [Alkalihalobacillus alcalophilus]THG89180.1 D-alanyl-D-alanine carboxypeptidase [Alkalihalobacillus alcalophilus ATCC 27647 = CGMCC 1.3604]
MKKSVLTVLVFMLLLPFSDFTQAANQRHFSVSAQAAILMEQSSGRVLYAKQEHEPLRIASITKIMTAILAIESGQLDEIVTVSERAFGTEGSSIFLRLNEKIKLEDLVYGLMLRSGNDAAVAIAEHVGGSLEGFVLLMNQKAEELGMSNTMFQNPHGLDDHEDHYSSVYDMALLTQYAMQNEDFQTISKTKSHRVDEGGDIRVWKNKNRMLTEFYPHSTGGKTGYTKRAKRTLVSTATKEEMDLIVVTINAPSDWHDHMNLFEWGFSEYDIETILPAGQVEGITDGFYENHIISKTEITYPLTVNEKENLKRELTLIKPPEKKEHENFEAPSPIGKVEFYLQEELIQKTPLYYDGPEKSEKKGFWSKWFHFFIHTLGVKNVD